MTTTTTATDRATQVALRKGFESIHLTVFATADGFEVTGASIYNTSQGGRVGGVKTRPFGTEDSAREFANGWYRKLVSKGWQRIR
jgi:hypothetical protein